MRSCSLCAMPKSSSVQSPRNVSPRSIGLTLTARGAHRVALLHQRARPNVEAMATAEVLSTDEQFQALDLQFELPSHWRVAGAEILPGFPIALLRLESSEPGREMFVRLDLDKQMFIDMMTPATPIPVPKAVWRSLRKEAANLSSAILLLRSRSASSSRSGTKPRSRSGSSSGSRSHSTSSSRTSPKSHTHVPKAKVRR
jgi:hypothetical protein